MNSPSAKRQRTTVSQAAAQHTLSCLEQLPFDVFADTVLLYDPVLNANVLASVSKRMRVQVRDAVQTPGFFQRMVQRCFPLITRLPANMRDGGGGNASWRTLFLRLMDMILRLTVGHDSLCSDDLDWLTKALAEGRIATWNDNVLESITYMSNSHQYVTNWGHVHIAIILPSEDTLPFEYFVPIPGTEEQILAKILPALNTSNCREHEFWMEAPIPVLENGDGNTVLELYGHFFAEQFPVNPVFTSQERIRVSIDLRWSMYDDIELRPRRIDDAVLARLQRHAPSGVLPYKPRTKGFSMECVVPREA